MRTKKRLCSETPAFHRYGFSILDLIIVVAVLGILSILLLPLVQSARASARNTVCEQRMQDIATDAILYDMVKSRLPVQIGAIGGTSWRDYVDPTSNSHWGFQQSTSPLALGASVSTDFRIDPIFFNDFVQFRQEPRFWDRLGWRQVVSTKLDRYRCPAASGAEFPPPEAYYVCIQPVTVPGDQSGTVFEGLGILTDSREGSDYGITNYVGCLGASSAGSLSEPGGTWQWRGMVPSRELITLDEVTNADGLANTIMYGENIGTIKTIDGQRVVERNSTWFSGAIARGRGAAPWQMQGNPILRPLLGRADLSFAYGFGSAHRAGVNFVYGDGSVHLITRNIDRPAYYALCGAFDTDP